MHSDKLRRLQALRDLREKTARGRLAAANMARRTQQERRDEAVKRAEISEATAKQSLREAVAKILSEGSSGPVTLARLSLGHLIQQTETRLAFERAFSEHRDLTRCAEVAKEAQRAWSSAARGARKCALLAEKLTPSSVDPD